MSGGGTLRRLAAALAAASMLSGCITTGTGLGKEGDQQGHLLDRAIQDGRADRWQTAPTLDRLEFSRWAVQTKNQRVRAAELDRLGDREAVMVVDSPELTAYVQGIVDRLAMAWPGKRPDIQAQVYASPSFMAFASPSRKIYVSLGALKSIESEDELAWLMAHEMTHIGFGHFAREDSKEDRREIVRWMRDVGYITAYGRDQKVIGHGPNAITVSRNDPKNRRLMLLSRSVQLMVEETSESLLDPGWERGQEDEADLNGIDLMVRAGYNPGAAQTALERLGADAGAVQRRSREGRMSEAAILAAAALMEDKVQVARSSWVPKVAGVAGRAVDAVYDMGRSGHSETDIRLEAVAAYIEREYLDVLVPLKSDSLLAVRSRPSVQQTVAAHEEAYRVKMLVGDFLSFQEVETPSKEQAENAERGVKEADRRSLAALRGTGAKMLFPLYMRANLLMATKHYSDAAKVLREAATNPNAPTVVFGKLAEAEARSGRWDQANAALNEGERRLGDEGRMLPWRVQVASDVNRPQEAQDAYDRCQKRNERPIRAACSSVVGKEDGGLLVLLGGIKI